MEQTKEKVLAAVQDTTANPAPLGLLGFGMTTVLLNIHNTGFYELGAMILAMGVFYGGLAQIFAGWMEWKKGNTFGTVAFSSYGLFWLTLVGLLLGPKLGWWEGTSEGLMAWYFFFWGLFTLCMFIGTLRLNRALQVVFATLVILFWLLAIRDWAGGNEIVGKIAGWEGIICGLSAIYAAFAQILNDVYGRVILPLGPVKK
ncbi:MAG: acetate uptake transporter [Thermoleophilia bacterium]|nr:acetate uptake transporter [Thermoleophilia bacterium]